VVADPESGQQIEVPYLKMYQSDPKNIVTALKYDDKHGKLWYSTPGSQINCLFLSTTKATGHMFIPGKLLLL
jgi:hypothetical protein